MEILLLILTSLLLSAFSLLVYWVGYHEGLKANQKSGISITKENREALKGIAEWLNYGGRNESE